MSYQKLTAMHLKLDKKMFIRYYAIAKRRNILHSSMEVYPIYLPVRLSKMMEPK